MKPSITACLTLLIGLAVPAFALAAEGDKSLPDTDIVTQFSSQDRMYFREHRLRAYERTRAGTRQGATCVTPKGVCWIAEPISSGNDCSCESRRFGTIHGTVGG